MFLEILLYASTSALGGPSLQRDVYLMCSKYKDDGYINVFRHISDSTYSLS